MSPLARAVLTITLLATIHPSSAGAQITTEPRADLVVANQPVWHAAGDDLDLRLRVFNLGSEPLDGFTLSIAAYDDLGSRSELHESFDGTTGLTSSFPVDLRERVVGAGLAADVLVDEPVSSLLTIGQSLEGAVHPLTVTLYAADGVTTLDSVTTQILYYPTLEDIRPLIVTPVWAVNEVPSRNARGEFVRDPVTGAYPLEAALTEDGWLQTMVGAVESRAGSQLHLGVAPTPRLIEELADMASGFVRAEDEDGERVPRTDERARAAADVLARLRSALGLRGVQPVLVPYSFPDLPTLTGLESLNAQVVEGEAVIRATLGVTSPRRWVFPPAGRMDMPTLENLRAIGAGAGIFLGAESLTPGPDPAVEGCPESFASFTCPVRIETLRGDTVGLAHDAELQDRFAELIRAEEGRVALQNLFAELAMIWAELPGVENRVVLLTIPSFWRPSSRQAELFFRGLANAPWIETATPREAVRRAAQPFLRDVADVAPETQNKPPEAFFDALATAEQTIESFGRIGPPRDVLERLRRAVLVAHSRLWWTDPVQLARGESFATDASALARREMDKISVGSVGQITLTSRRGSIPLVVFNDTGYPVTLTIRLSSPNLDLDPPSITKTFGPGSPQESVEASALASGIFPLSITLETPADAEGGGYVIQNTSIRVRSTEFNEVALGITVGALAFLILFYVVRAVRRKPA